MPGGTSPVQKLNAQLVDLLATHFWRRKEGGVWKYLQAPLTSGSWTGNAFSTTAKTLIDLSAVFSVPAGVKAVDVLVSIHDEGSAGGNCYLVLAPNDTADQGKFTYCSGLPNDVWHAESHAVPCDANGDIYYQIVASGAGTLDVYLQVWGYCK